MSNLAQQLAKNVGPYKVSQNDIQKYGGKWSDEYALYIFPDGSTGAYTDISHGAQERDSRGEPIYHFDPGH